jgi:hypothetical protein
MDGYYMLPFVGFGVYFLRFLSICEVFPHYLYRILFVYSFFLQISVFVCSCFLVIVLSVCLLTTYTRPFLRGSHVQVLIVHGCIPQKFSLCCVECWLQDRLCRIFYSNVKTEIQNSLIHACICDCCVATRMWLRCTS